MTSHAEVEAVEAPEPEPTNTPPIPYPVGGSQFQARLSNLTDQAARQGYLLHPKHQPPYGWELVDQSGSAPMYGSLDQVAAFLGVEAAPALPGGGLDRQYQEQDEEETTAKH